MEVLAGGLLRKPVRVIIADDDALMRSLVRANLADRVDTITEAADGKEAWDLLLGRTFELAMIDLSMPGIDGYTLIRCMRGHPRTRNMPIIVITSSTDKAAVTRAFDVGATSFLTKPINWALFGHHIDYLVRLSQGSSADRTAKQRAEAVIRAKDAVIATLAARVRAHSQNLIDMSEVELRRLAASTRDGDAEALTFAATMLTESHAIEEMLDAVLPHVRSMTEQILVDDRPVRVERLIENSIYQVEALAAARGVRIEVGDIHSMRICCDESAIVRAFTNLLRNAVEFTQPGSAVTIDVELRSDNVLALGVSDDGPGADPYVIAQSLAPLDQCDVAAGGTRGATLGLPMAKAIAQAHGGTVEVMARAGGGSHASLILPAEIVEAAMEDAA